MAEPTARITGSGGYSDAELPAPRRRKGLATRPANDRAADEAEEMVPDPDESETHELDTMA